MVVLPRGRGKVGLYLREGTIVPEITLVGEAVPDVSELAFLDVLLNGVEGLFLADLFKRVSHRRD